MTARAQKPGPAPRGPSQRTSPFSRPLDVRRLPAGGLQQLIEANEAERATLAAMMGLPAIASLAARCELRPRAGGRIALSGEVTADVTQLCVVTLEPFESRIVQEIELLFAPASPEQAGRRRDDIAVAASHRPVPGSDDQADPPDPIIDDTIDLGAVAAEFVALALDPYPRRPGASFDDLVAPPDADEPSAFSALERLKAKP